MATNNVEILEHYVIAAYLDNSATATISKSFRRHKGITMGQEEISKFNKLREIISFFNTKAPVKNRLVLPGASKALTMTNGKKQVSDDSDSDDEDEEPEEAKSKSKVRFNI